MLWCRQSSCRNLYQERSIRSTLLTDVLNTFIICIMFADTHYSQVCVTLKSETHVLPLACGEFSMRSLVFRTLVVGGGHWFLAVMLLYNHQQYFSCNAESVETHCLHGADQVQVQAYCQFGEGKPFFCPCAKLVFSSTGIKSAETLIYSSHQCASALIHLLYLLSLHLEVRPKEVLKKRYFNRVSFLVRGQFLGFNKS